MNEDKPKVDKQAKIKRNLELWLLKEERKDQQRLQRRCFWTWPLGHKYAKMNSLWLQCVGCGKHQWDAD